MYQGRLITRVCVIMDGLERIVKVREIKGLCYTDLYSLTAQTYCGLNGLWWCKNGGDCVDNEDGTYYCNCLSNYYQERCMGEYNSLYINVSNNSINILSFLQVTMCVRQQLVVEGEHVHKHFNHKLWS